ncbi:MAG: hypothetical protein ACYTHJ_08910 [Planctomycetota bacterium]
MTNQEDRINELEQLKVRVAELEDEISLRSVRRDETPWPPTGYYTTYHLLAGMVLGLIAASASLVFNIVGAAMFDKHPLEIIRVYLTFPLGEAALTLDSGFALAAGCCLYLATGVIGGIPFHLILTRYFSDASFVTRFIVASILGLGVWVINYYGILIWLQPALVGGRWIVDQVPVLVAILTHLVFGWTMMLVAHWGRYVAPASQQEGLA